MATEESDVQQDDPILTVQQFSAKIKAKYPQYADMDDNDLAQKIIAKYPQYASQVDMGTIKKKSTDSGIPPSLQPPSSSAPENGISSLEQNAATIASAPYGNVPAQYQVPTGAEKESNITPGWTKFNAQASPQKATVPVNTFEQQAAPGETTQDVNDIENGEWGVKPALAQIIGGAANQVKGVLGGEKTVFSINKALSFNDMMANMGIKPPVDPNVDPESFRGYLKKFMNVALTISDPTKIPGTLPAEIMQQSIPHLDQSVTGMQQYAAANPLPDTFAGKATTGLLQLTPTVIAMMATGGAPAIEEATAPILETGADGYLTKLGMTQNALGIVQKSLTKLGGPLTQYLATTKAFAGANDAYDANKGDVSKTLEGFTEGGIEGAKEGASLELQMAAGGAIGGKLFELAQKSGLANEEGILTEQALKSFIGSPVAFAVSSAANDVANNKPIDWENAGISAATAVPFEAAHVFEAYNQSTDLSEKKQTLDKAINNAVSVRDNNAVINFMLASPQDVLETMQNPKSSEELQIQSLAKGVSAQNTDNYNEKNILHLQQLELQKQADVKRMGEVIINHGVDGFVQGVNNSSLPDETKAVLANKATAIDKVFNPIERQKTAVGQNIDELNDQIQVLHTLPTENIPPEQLSDNLVKLNDLTAQRVKAQGDLFNLSYADQEHQKEGVDLANKVAENPITDAENISTAPAETITDDNKTTVPVNNAYLKDAEITGIHDNGDVTIRQNDGTEETVNNKEWPHLGITNDDIQTFRIKNPPAPEEGESEQRFKLRTTTDPGELANMYHDKVQDLQNNFGLEGAIADYGPTIRADEFNEHDDRNHVSKAIAGNYFLKKGTDGIPIDTQAQEINDLHFNGTETVTPGDITDFIKKYPGGRQTYFKPEGNSELADINNRYREVTGKNLRMDIARKLADKYNVAQSEAIKDEQVIDSPHSSAVIQQKIDELVHTDGIHAGFADYDRIEEQLDKYNNDTANEWNIWHQVFDGKTPHEEQLKDIKAIIDEHRANQGDSDRTGQKPTDGISDSLKEPATEGAGEPRTEGESTENTGQTGLTDEQDPWDTEAASKSRELANEKIDPETQGLVKGAMANLFPNIETHYYNNEEDFNNSIEDTSLKTMVQNGGIIHAFVDKNRVIHFNPEYMTKDTQLHEQGHILTNWAYHYAPELYKRMITAGGRMGDIHKELTKNGYGPARGTHFYEEAFVTALGREGAGKLDELVKGLSQRSSVQRLIHEAWTKFERWVAGRTGFSLSKFKNIQNMDFGEFAKYVNEKYLLSDVKVSDISSEKLKGKNREAFENAQFTNQPVKEPGETLSNYARRIADWKDEIDKEHGTGIPIKESEKSDNEEPKEVKKTILTTRAYEGNISDDVKKYLEEKGLTRTVFSQKQRSNQATDFINKFGEDAAFQAVKSGDVEGGMAASILAQLQIKNNRAMSEMPIGSDERNDLAKKQADVIEYLENKGYIGGEFNGQLAHEYENAELGYAEVKRRLEKLTDKPLTQAQEIKIKNITDENKKLKAQLEESEAKLVDETDKTFKGEEKTQPNETKSQKSKRVADKLRDAAKIHRPNMFLSATPASLAWDTAVELVAKGIETGGKVADAIDAGIEHIKNTDWYKSLPDNKKILAENEFKRFNNDNIGSTDLADLQERFLGKSDNNFTNAEAKDIWGYMKDKYIENGTSYRDAISKTADDLGLSWRQISEAITTPKNKRISDEMWKKQYDYTRNRTTIKNWIEDQNKSVLGRALKSVSGVFRGVSVFGHGGIFMGTHAGTTLFNPTTLHLTIPAFFRGWKFAYGNEGAYQRSIEELKNNPNYLIAQRAGLKNNPERLNAEEYQKSQHYLGKLGMAGEKGFNAIKVLRQDLFDYHYNNLSASERDDPATAASIANLVNVATGATNIKIPAWVNEASFAGGIEASRWEKLTSNPVKATGIALSAIFDPDKASTEDKVFAKVWARRVGEQLATYTGLLIANAAIQNIINPKNPVNITNPNKPDFLKFKTGNITIDPTSGTRATAMFIYELAKVPLESKKQLHGDSRMKVGGKDIEGYARGKLAPLYSTVADFYGSQDYNGNPLPYSHDKPGKYAHKLTWGEYAWQKAPLPVAEAAQVAYQSAIEHGAHTPTLNHVLDGILSGAISGTTGFRVGEYDADLPKNKKKE